MCLDQKRAALELAEVKAKAVAERDPVSFARLYLDFDPDPWQADFLRSRAPKIILNNSRQSGKSTVTAALALFEAATKPGSFIVLDSPSLRQSQELMMKFSDFLGKIDKDIKLDTDTKLSAHFANGSRVLALPGTEKTIRGLSAVTLLVIDEAARVPDELYFSVKPMLAVSQGRLIALSTPFGKRGWFYDEWVNGVGWERFTVTADQCPRISKEFLEAERRSMPRPWFEAEYFCAFNEPEDCLFSYEDIDAMIDESVEPLEV